MQEGLLLGEGWAPSNEAVCSAESCLAVAHRSELLQLPGCQEPSIVPDSPAGLRAIDRGGSDIIILPDETPHLPLHRRHLSPSPEHSHRSSPVFFSRYRVTEQRVASSFFLTGHIHRGIISFPLSWVTVGQPRSLPPMRPACRVRAEKGPGGSALR